MVVIQSYGLAVAMCFITMLCWGSWANTQKLATKEWRFQLFYWDYCIGVLLMSLIMALTLGSYGSGGRAFFDDLGQASSTVIWSALLGGIIFNVGNILLVTAIEIAGMAVAFPIGVGLALVIGVVMNYIIAPLGNPVLLFVGVAGIIVAVILDAIAYKKLSTGGTTPVKGIVISVLSGVCLGLFYPFVAKSMPALQSAQDFIDLEPGKLGPYSALVVSCTGILLSSFLWNTIAMAKPLVGEPVAFGDYFKKGNVRLHTIGIVGGLIWCLGFSFSVIASSEAGFAISYGLGQGATMVAAFWGVFIWKEFKAAPTGTNKLLTLMFAFYIISLVLIIISRLVV